MYRVQRQVWQQYKDLQLHPSSSKLDRPMEGWKDNQLLKMAKVEVVVGVGDERVVGVSVRGAVGL